MPCSAFSLSLPGPADLDKIDFSTEFFTPAPKPPIEFKLVTPEPPPKPIYESASESSSTAELKLPALTSQAPKQPSFQLRNVNIKGVTIFPKPTLDDIYKPYLGKHITLDIISMMAEQITEHYRDEGYFLSRAYVPAQEINDGIITIDVVEGYIAEVKLDETIAKYSLVQTLVQQLIAQRPLNAYKLESFMLQLNDLPGIKFRAFIEPLESADIGAVKLSLHKTEEKGRSIIKLDNFGSRFLGPYQGTVIYQNSFLPLQKTTLSTLVSLPVNELKYIGIQHQIPIYPDWNIDFSGSYINANDINSESMELGIGISYQHIRQWQRNLIFSLGLDGKNTNGDVLNNTPLIRDHIRALRWCADFDIADKWMGYNYINTSINQGLEVLDSSAAGDTNLSRAKAKPNFTTLKIDYTRHQAIGVNWLAIAKFSGQVASSSLFSAEEFSYGGRDFGRAYDSSEIAGDHGTAAGIELRYINIIPWGNISLTPYAFGDVGKIWNKDFGGKSNSAASTGFGARFDHASGIYSNIGLAWPIGRKPATPIYGGANNPRIIFEVSYGL